MKKSLFALALGGFGIGMTEFVMMGVLPDIATSLNVSIPSAGHLISSYALGVVLGAPLLVALAGNYPPKKILVGLMYLFTIFNGLTAFGPNYEILFLARLFSGLPHGAFFGVGAVVASRIAVKGKEAQAVSMMFVGLAIANVIGVPLGTYIGHHFSWRITFGIIGVIGIFTILSLKKWLPEMQARENTKLSDDLKLFARLDTWLAILITSIGTGGLFSWFSYIAPLLTEVTGFEASSITWVLVVAGLGMVTGNLIGGKLADKFSPLKAVIFLLFMMSFSLVMMAIISNSKVLIVSMTFITALIAFALAAPIQMMIIGVSKESEMLGSSLGQASFNIGNAIGAYLGGLPLTMGYSYTAPEYVGAALAFSGALIACVMFIKNFSHKRQSLSA